MRDQRSAEAYVYRAWYNTKRWRVLRADHIAREPLCRMCLADGVVNAGQLTSTGKPQTDPRRRFLVCDHVEPHRGDEDKFWNGAKQTLCPDHHDITKQQVEARGYVAGSTVDGRPRDPAHPWNQRC